MKLFDCLAQFFGVALGHAISISGTEPNSLLDRLAVDHTIDCLVESELEVSDRLLKRTLRFLFSRLGKLGLTRFTFELLKKVDLRVDNFLPVSVDACQAL